MVSKSYPIENCLALKCGAGTCWWWKRLRFESAKAFRQLMERGVVATMRRNGYYRKGMRVWIVRGGKWFGRGLVVDVLPNTEENRLKYFRISGFGSVEEWVSEATKLHGRLPPAIVLVELLGKLKKHENAKSSKRKI